jgi:hypothetical protein
VLHEVLTAENLSATFGLPLTIEFRGDRWWARAL